MFKHLTVSKSLRPINDCFNQNEKKIRLKFITNFSLFTFCCVTTRPYCELFLEIRQNISLIGKVCKVYTFLLFAINMHGSTKLLSKNNKESVILGYLDRFLSRRVT